MNTSCPETAEWQEIANGFASLYNEKSPISFTIVAGAILEGQVLRTLSKIVPGISKKHADITHELRVWLLSEMGIITQNIAESLHYYARIRNAFAHRPHTTAFDTEKVRALAENLRSKLEAETGPGGFEGHLSAQAALDAKFRALGAEPPWNHPVARTLTFGYFTLAYYLVWARHWTPVPQQAKSIGEIGQHVCEKAMAPATNPASAGLSR